MEHTQDVEAVLTTYGKEVLASDISGLKIFIYRLPNRFNLELITCAIRNKVSGMCFDFLHGGFGAEMKELNEEVPKNLRYYKTHQFSLEVIFHHKLLRSPYLTRNPDEADLFYIPFYAGLSCFCDQERAQDLTTEFWSTAKNLSHLNTGKVHFMALGKVEQVKEFPV